MKKDYKGIFIDSKQSVVRSGPTNLFQQQINSMKEKRFLGVHQSAKELVSAFQDPDEYSKISIEKTPHKYKQLAGYCILVRDKSHFGLKPVLFNLPGNFTSQKPLLDKYLGYELENDPKMPSYITSSLGQRAIRELVPNNNVFAAVEFGKGLDSRRINDGTGANVVVPRGLISFVPRIAHSLAMLSKFHSQKSPMIDYYERVSSTEESIDNTKMLVLSGFYKAINSVK